VVGRARNLRGPHPARRPARGLLLGMASLRAALEPLSDQGTPAVHALGQFPPGTVQGAGAGLLRASTEPSMLARTSTVVNLGGRNPGTRRA